MTTTVRERQVLPAGLAEMKPGPELSAALDGIDESRLTGFDCVEVARARYRQLAHEQAKFFKIVAEVGNACEPDGLRRAEELDEFSAVELSPALRWSQRKAESQLDMAAALAERLPMVLAALEAGRLDEPKARAFVNWTRDLTVEQARQIAVELLPEAPSLTVSELIRKIKACAVAIDPSWAERRYRAAVAAGDVTGRLNRDGSVDITGKGLPAERGAAACARVTDLARRARRAGDQRKIKLIRVDIFLGELEGRFTGWSDDQIVDYLVEQGRDADLADEPERQGMPKDMGCPGYSDDDLPDDDDGDRGPSGDDGGGPDKDGGGSPGRPSTAGWWPGGADSEHGGTDRDSTDRDGHVSSGDDANDGRATGDGDADNADHAPSRVGDPGHGAGELRIGISTLLGMDERPGELAEWGPIGAGLGRFIAEEQRNGEWRFVLLDDSGSAVNAGLLRSRPHPLANGPPRRRSRDAIVEIHVPLGLLDRLAADPVVHGARWAPVIRWLALQPRFWPPRDDGDRRTATAALRRAVQLRDRFCTFPCCPITAARSDQDHVKDHARGGLTRETNLTCACRFNHRCKHEGGWEVIALPDEEITVWISPLAQVYLTRPDPIMMELPEPMAGPAEPEIPPGPEARRFAEYEDRCQLRQSILKVGYPITGEEAEELARLIDEDGHLRPRTPEPPPPLRLAPPYEPPF